MAAPRVLPSASRLKRMVDQGLTHQQIADIISAEEGVRIGRSAVSAELSRAGYTNRVRYADTLPWKIRPEHGNNYHAWMLRLHHKLQHGQRLRPGEPERHASWLAKLQDNDAVVTYIPDSEYGFYLVQRRPGDTDCIRPPENYSEVLAANE